MSDDRGDRGVVPVVVEPGQANGGADRTIRVPSRSVQTFMSTQLIDRA